MPTYSANQYNNATPLGTFPNLYSELDIQEVYKYFVLNGSNLDGSSLSINASSDKGWWGASLSTTGGVIPAPSEVTVSGIDQIHYGGMAVQGDVANNIYPVDFTITTRANGAVTGTFTVTGNTQNPVMVNLGGTYLTDSVTIRVTRINVANSVVRLNRIAGSVSIRFTDRLYVNFGESSVLSDLKHLYQMDADYIDFVEAITRHTVYAVYSDTLGVNLTEYSELFNIHSVMKQPTRHVLGRVEVSYSNPLKEGNIDIESPFLAKAARPEQLFDGIADPTRKYFATFDSDLSGEYQLVDETDQVGWFTEVLSDSSGSFSTPVTLTYSFSERPVTDFNLVGDSARGLYPVDFDVVYYNLETSQTMQVRGNASVVYNVEAPTLVNVTEIQFIVYTISRPNAPLILMESSVESVVVYEGDQLFSINMFEELSYQDETGVLGGVSANELTVAFRNDDEQFYFNSPKGRSARQLRRNRRIKAWLGAEVSPEVGVEWHPLGTYWSYKWTIPMHALSATCVAFDTLGLLEYTEFYNHQVYFNVSLGTLIRLIMLDASEIIEGLEYVIDPALDAVYVPMAWFDFASHMNALNLIAQAYPIDIFCDRLGRVVARARKVVDEYYDVWSDSTNVITKEYPTLYADVPNVFSVIVNAVRLEDSVEIINIDVPFTVVAGETKDFAYTQPATSQQYISTSIPASAYTVQFFSWGCRVTFNINTTVTDLVVTAQVVKQEDGAVLVARNETSVREDGEILREVRARFIQETERARLIASQMLAASNDSIYNAEVRYTGDIALSIGDPIKVLDGIAPTDNYLMRRQELFWNGGLSGNAFITTREV